MPRHTPTPRAPYLGWNVALLVEQVFLGTQVEVVNDEAPLFRCEISLLEQCGERAVELVIASIEIGEDLVEERCLCEFLLLHEVAKAKRAGNYSTNESDSLVAPKLDSQKSGAPSNS